MTTTSVFDLLVPAGCYARVRALFLAGGGKYAVKPGTLVRRHDARVGEIVEFDTGDGSSSVAVVQIVGASLEP